MSTLTPEARTIRPGARNGKLAAVWRQSRRHRICHRLAHRVKLNSTIAVEASPNGRQIAIMRGIFNLHDRYTFWNGEKYTQAILPGVILTVATIDIASNLSVGSPNVVFNGNTHYPTNYSATANAHDRQLYQSLGTWWFSILFRA